KLGSGSVYTLAAIGGGRDFLAAGLGLGVHVPHASWWLDADVSSYVIRGTDFRATGIDQLAELRVMAGFPITSQLSLFAGVSANATFDYDRGAPLDVALVTAREIMTRHATVTLSPGLFAGVSY